LKIGWYMNIDVNHPWVVIDRIADVVLAYVDGCIVEIGAGLSTLIFEEYAKIYSRTFYTVDKRISKCNWVKENTTYDKVVISNQSSNKFMESFGDSPAVVLLDGSHKVSTVKAEALFFLDRMNIGGVLFIHDTAPQVKHYERKVGQGKKMNTYEVRKFLEKDDRYDVFTWRYTAAKCGLTMVLKKDMNDPIYRT